MLPLNGNEIPIFARGIVIGLKKWVGTIIGTNARRSETYKIVTQFACRKITGTIIIILIVVGTIKGWFCRNCDGGSRKSNESSEDLDLFHKIIV
jgi:hypothetical protein